MPTRAIRRRQAARNKYLKRIGREPWMDDHKYMVRILTAHEKYIRRKPVVDIAQDMGVSTATIYLYIRRSTAYKAMLFDAESKEYLVNQVDARRALTADMRKSIDYLKDTARDDEEGWSPDHARAEAAVFKLIMENERAVEEMVGLRVRTRQQGRPSDDDPMPNTGQMPVNPMIIDARTVIYNESAKEKDTRVLEGQVV